jgi:hypothetical protein
VFRCEDTDVEPDSLAQAREAVRRPAVAQEQGDRDQPWVLAGGHTSRGADESIELVGDVQLVEQGEEEATRPLETVGTRGEVSKHLAAVALSPVLHLDALGRPGA